MSPSAQRWLKALHIVFAALWLSSALSLVLLGLFVLPEAGSALHGATAAMKFIDDFVIIPAANLCLLTGLIYGVWTRWGFFRHDWVIVKWAVTIYGIVVGTVWLGPWMNEMASLAASSGRAALETPAWQHASTSNLVWGGVQAATLFLATFVSVLKPWGRRNRST